MNNSISLKDVPRKNIYGLNDKFYGRKPSGEELSFTNYYIQINGNPYFGISGEIHFSRVSAAAWEDELLKMKMSGINVISTYVFWIHHEEVEGRFRFDGNRDLRHFVELCKALGLYVIVRIGPFCHGEVRNGGMPDWLYGKPFEVRSLDEGFLRYVRILYKEIAGQLNGLYYKDNGPIIAAQMDNEYMHSAAPWEMTTGISNEWVPGGSDGNAYMLKLKEIATEAGIVVPFYTCTGWGGAMAPAEEMLPLWGGYAFRPWIFYSHKGEHPATSEYIYRDNHNNDVPKTYNFEPTYRPESRPYACCEMGGGMMCSYNYRFQLPYQSVDAMANIKLGSGCNFLGYYMFKGGTNPLGEKTPFLNEGQVTKVSYDYQAALGEFGQIRMSYKRLKALHMFLNSYGDILCRMKTVLPENSQKIAPEDTETLRYAVRLHEQSGFVFINNYQDHAQTRDKTGEKITLEFPGETIEIADISIARDENAILPFNFSMNGYLLKYATAQPLTWLEHDGTLYYFFFAPEGMTPVYCFDTKDIDIEKSDVEEWKGGYAKVYTCLDQMSSFTLEGNHGRVVVVTLTREDSLNAYLLQLNGQKTLILSNDVTLYENNQIRIESMHQNVQFLSFPEAALQPVGEYEPTQYQIFKGFNIKNQSHERNVTAIQQVGPTRYAIWVQGKQGDNSVAFNFEEPRQFSSGTECFESENQGDCIAYALETSQQLPSETECFDSALLQIEYTGDIGQAFIDGRMISDNFCNGAPWEIGLKEFEEDLKNNPITIYITPLKKDSNVNVDTAMAARLEEVGDITGKLLSVRLKNAGTVRLLPL